MMKRIAAAITVLAFELTGCTTAQVASFQKASDNFNAVVVAINSNIATVSPLVAKSCADLQYLALLIAPLVPQKAKAPQYFAAANGALIAYCQSVPTNIGETATAVAAALAAARNGYYNVSGKRA